MADDGRQQHRLADLCESIDYGFTTSAKEESVGPKFLRITDIVGGGIDWSRVPFCEIEPPKKDNYRLHAGDIVIARTGANTGYSAYLSFVPDAVFASYLVRLKIREPHSSRFVAYYLKGPQFWNYMYGVLGDKSAQPNASATTLTLAPIDVPSPNVQDRIADVLGTLDDKIELNRRMNRTLEKMAAAIFKSWFIDFDPVHAKAEGRDPNLPADIADLFPDRFEDSELGRIPKGWTVAPMKDLADVNVSSIKKDYPHARIRYVDISSVSQGSLDQTTAYDLPDAPSRARRLVQTGDTIWSCVRPNRKAYLYIDRPADNLVVSTGFAVLTPRAVPASYLHQWVTTQAFVDYLTAYATGAAYPAVKADTFEMAKIVVASKGILNAFHDLVGPLRARIAHNQRQNRRLSGLGDTLLPKLLSGEIELGTLPAPEAVGDWSLSSSIEA